MARLFMKALCCDETTEHGDDEIYIVVAGKYSNGQSFGYRIPNAPNHWSMNEDGTAHRIDNIDLANFNLNDGESVSLVVTIMEEDGGNPAKYTDLVDGILSSTSNPYAIGAGAIIGIIGRVWPTDSDDWIGTFSCEISRNGGSLSVNWRPVARVSNVINSIHGRNTCEFRMNGDGSNYVGWYHIVE